VRARAYRIVLVALVVLLALLPSAAAAAPDGRETDWDVAGGHFFTQTSGSPSLGFAVTDEGGIGFWSAFQQIGGVNVVGYPISQRFTHGGFVTQAMQKAVFQWRADAGTVAFVNVFDDLSAAARDDFLNSARSTPKPTAFPAEAGKPFDQVVAIRQAALDARPAMKGIYFAATNPVQLYGLPTSQVVDMGNHYAIRLQRAVIQEWKQDVPWARAGQATVANGGDIAKEAGLFPAKALVPTEPVGATPTVGQSAGPVKPPAPAPVKPNAPIAPGVWGGPMNPAPGAILFEVSADGTRLTELVFVFQLPPSAGCGPDELMTAVDLRQGGRPIVGGAFEFWVSDEAGKATIGVTGRFTSASTLTGTYEFYSHKPNKSDGEPCGTVNGKGTWQAKPRS
jgi:hypothetical protein